MKLLLFSTSCFLLFSINALTQPIDKASIRQSIANVIEDEPYGFSSYKGPLVPQDKQEHYTSTITIPGTSNNILYGINSGYHWCYNALIYTGRSATEAGRKEQEWAGYIKALFPDYIDTGKMYAGSRMEVRVYVQGTTDNPVQLNLYKTYEFDSSWTVMLVVDSKYGHTSRPRPEQEKTVNGGQELQKRLEFYTAQIAMLVKARTDGFLSLRNLKLPESGDGSIMYTLKGATFLSDKDGLEFITIKKDGSSVYHAAFSTVQMMVEIAFAYKNAITEAMKAEGYSIKIESLDARHEQYKILYNGIAVSVFLLDKQGDGKLIILGN